MAEMTLLGFAGLLTQLGVGIPAAQHEGLEKAAVIVETESKRVIGTYEYGWPPLKPETVARKANGDTPLLETGAMRESIQHNSDTNDAHIGSNEDKALWQEMGTVHIPPRSFLAEAARRKEKEVVDAIGDAVFIHLVGGGGMIGPTKP